MAATEKAKEKKNGFLLYKGRPLVRSGNTLYYGNMADKCVVMFQILSTKTVGDMTMAWTRCRCSSCPPTWSCA